MTPVFPSFLIGRLPKSLMSSSILPLQSNLITVLSNLTCFGCVMAVASDWLATMVVLSFCVLVVSVFLSVYPASWASFSPMGVSVECLRIGFRLIASLLLGWMLPL